MNTPTNLPPVVVPATPGVIAGAPAPTPVATPVSFPITIFPDLRAATLARETHTLSSLANRIRNTVVQRKQDQPLLSGNRYGGDRTDRGSLRNNENVRGIHLVSIDYDKGGPRLIIDVVREHLSQANIAFLLHTTTSHTPSDTHFRLHIPLSREHPPSAHLRFVEEINFIIGGDAATESGTLSQSWYIGHLAGDNSFEIHHHDGPPVDLHANLKRRALAGQTHYGSKNGPPGGGAASNVLPLAAALGPRPRGLPNVPDVSINDNASANWSTGWFGALSPEIRRELLQTVMQHPAIIAIADTERFQGWFGIMSALKDAEAGGTPGVREIALDWCRTSSRRFQGEKDFDDNWNGIRTGRSGDITVGSLLLQAREAWFDFTACLAHLGVQGRTGGATPPSGPPPGPPPGSSPGPSPQPGPGPGNSFIPPPRFSENELAYRFSGQHATDLLYVHEWGKWLRWERGRWREDHAVTVFTEARKICAQEAEVAYATLSPRIAPKVAATINKASCVAAIERLSRHHPSHVRSAEMFDADPLALNGPGTIAAL